MCMYHRALMSNGTITSDTVGAGKARVQFPPDA